MQVAHQLGFLHPEQKFKSLRALLCVFGHTGDFSVNQQHSVLEVQWAAHSVMSVRNQLSRPEKSHSPEAADLENSL